MTHTADNTLISNREMFGALFAKIGNAVLTGLVKIAEGSARYAALERLNATTDEELAARGVTRAEAAQQVFGYHI